MILHYFVPLAAVANEKQMNDRNRESDRESGKAHA